MTGTSLNIALPFDFVDNRSTFRIVIKNIFLLKEQVAPVEEPQEDDKDSVRYAKR